MLTKSKKATIQVRIDEDVKSQAVEVLNDLGMDASTAINVFLRQVIAENGLPFQPAKPRLNDVTLKAIKEADEVVESGELDRKKSVDDLFSEVFEEV
ncbi:type II toxin-antitoxin system RelB/DinJ family antitoxin [Metaplanococcus flavidus]|uniref:Type II toxin-antitoxin system RelB/DinJ family antitoxin n=1 Tax=Metaplanococcus flavidus TaxID=569883 RepID=A0ABW3LDE4_9BACL